MTFLGSKRLGNALWSYVTYGTGKLQWDSPRYQRVARFFRAWAWVVDTCAWLAALAVLYAMLLAAEHLHRGFGYLVLVVVALVALYAPLLLGRKNSHD